MKRNPSLLTVLSLAFVLDASAFSVGPFAPQRTSRPSASEARPATARLFGSVHDDELESEWYSPSAATAAAAASKPAPAAPRNSKPLLTQLDGRTDFDDYTGQQATGDNRLTVVMFHASWCKTCHKVMQQYKKLASQVADYAHVETQDIVQAGSMRLAQLEYSQHTALCQELGIVKLPTLQLYRGGKKLASMSCGPSKFAQVRQVIHDFEQQTHLVSSHSELQSLERMGNSLQQAIRNTGAMAADVVPSHVAAVVETTRD